MVKFIEFLRPDLKRIIVLLIILSPIIFSLFHFLPLPEQFGLLNTYFSNYIVMIPFLIVSCYFGGFDCGGLWVPVPVFYILTYSFGILVWYLISCLVVSLWNNIFRQFGEKKGQYEKIIIKSLIVIFILAIILPVIGSFFIITEINTRQSISLEEVFRRTYPEGTNLQEIKIRNYFVFPVSYELPKVNVCLYDADENFKIGIYANYRAENGRYVADMDQFHRNVIVAWPFVEEVVYLQYQGESSVSGEGIEKFRTFERDKFDEILLLTNVGMDNYNYCYNLNKEDIIVAEKIKISK